MPKSSHVLCAGLMAGAALLSASQTPTPQFRATTDLVLLDVSVLDKQRKAVAGLKQEDFTIIEDGQPQTISNFTPVVVASPEAPSA